MNKNGRVADVLFIVTLVFLGVYLLYLIIRFSVKAVALIGYNSFFYIDNLLYIKPFNPVVVWAIWGLVLGGFIGVMIAVKKLRVSKLLLIYPVGFIAVLLVIFGFINKPTEYNGQYVSPFALQDTVQPKVYYRLNRDGNVRAGPSRNEPVLFVLKKGYVVEVVGTNFVDDRGLAWFKVTDAGREGYISSKLLDFDSSR